MLKSKQNTPSHAAAVSISMNTFDDRDEDSVSARRLNEEASD